ncbi:unnamed protein product [Nippostrongylus brasiliensis]|uniref:Threonine aspartase 1 (inferred by orthology to a human protein) n=1 Tax=Nippostrongylus brasiliensis TaxID=27835 RepID=A0A0N4YQ90_NIPBR|nr:unnamed protein product [Nippostrongylus brasiliensis]
MIAVHGGVGFRNDRALSAACADALRIGEGDVVRVVSCLEENLLFNCGYGSNPTMSGTIECEACFMSSDGSKYVMYGAVGASTRLRNPSQVAKAIAFEDKRGGLVPPMVLVGAGAEEWAEKRGFALCNPEELATKKTTEIWRKALNAFEKTERFQMDTVGAISILDLATKKTTEIWRKALNAFEKTERFQMDTVGAISILEDAVEACTSSGGLMLKHPGNFNFKRRIGENCYFFPFKGRLGHCTAFGSGVWADRKEDRSIAVTVSGCGEAITRANFCRSLADRILQRSEDQLSSSVIHSFFEKEFLNSNLMGSIDSNRLYAGGLVLIEESDGFSELIIFHNTPVLPFAYRKGSTVSKGLSQLPPGSNILVESYPCR